MGLISETVLVDVGSRNKPYYKNKGYAVLEVIDKQGKLSTPKDTKIIVKVYDLPPNSQYRIDVVCDCCEGEFNITWQSYLRNIKKNKQYYCYKCALKLYGTKNRVVSALKNGESFEYWCMKNNRQDILDKWDYKKNELLPSQICYSSGLKYYFKCPNNNHESELKCISNIINNDNDIYCHQCNSFAQWGIDNIGEDFLEKYWDYDKNIVDPWDTSKANSQIVWINCQERNYHGSYEIRCCDFIYGSRCNLCNSNGSKVHILDSLASLYPNSLNMWSSKNKSSAYEYPPMSQQIAWWKCENGRHEDYLRSIKSSNMYKFRCPECVRERDESFLQEKVRLYLESLNYTILHEHKCTIVPINPKTKFNLPFDNEIVELKLIIEVMGSQHYEESSGLWFNKNFDLHYQKLKDRYKRIFAKSRGYFYLEIPYFLDDKDETWEKLIDEKINEITNTHKIYEVSEGGF